MIYDAMPSGFSSECMRVLNTSEAKKRYSDVSVVNLT